MQAEQSNRSTAMLRLSNSQAWQSDEAKTSSIHTQLHQGAEKIRKWKIQTEIDLKEKDRKLNESSVQIETLKKSLLEVQLENGKLNLKIQEEIDDRQEIILKMTTMTEMCNALKTQTGKLEETLHRYETEKMKLKHMERDHRQHFEELSNKFGDLQITSMKNHEQLLKKVETERQVHEMNTSEWTQKLAKCDTENAKLDKELKLLRTEFGNLQNSLQKTKELLETMTNMKNSLDEKTASLSSKLSLNEEELKNTSLRVVIVKDEKLKLEKEVKRLETQNSDLTESREKAYFEMDELKAKHEVDFEEVLKEKDVIEKALEDKAKKLKDCDLQLKDKTVAFENLRSSNDMLQLEKIDIEMQLGVNKLEIETLQREKDEEKEINHQLNGEIDVLMKKLDKEYLCSQKYQEEIDDLETRISDLKLENDVKIDDLENDIATLQDKIKSLEADLSSEKDKVLSHEKEIQSMKDNVNDTRKEQDRIQTSVDQLDNEILLKDSQICAEKKKNADLQEKIEQLQTKNDDLHEEFVKIHKELEDVQSTYENEKRKSDDLCHKIKDITQKNKEQLKHTKSELTAEKKRVTEKEKRITTLEAANEQLTLSHVEIEKDMEIKIEQCKRDQEASSLALKKAEEMQIVIQHEKEQSKAMMANELDEMMATLDGYKQNSEKILAQKDTELEMLRNKLADLKSSALIEKQKYEEEKKNITSAMAAQSKQKEALSIQLNEITSKHQEVVNKLRDLECTVMASKGNEAINPSMTKDRSIDDSRLQCNPPTTPVVHVTPQKQQIVLSPVTPSRMTSYMTPNQNILKTPQRSILRTCNSVPKRRKVVFSADKYAMNSSSEESDLMELDVGKSCQGLQNKCYTPVRNKSPFIPEVYNFGKSPLKTPPRSGIVKTDENSTMMSEQNQTPNLRKAPVRKTSKFFTTSPRVKAASRAKSKPKNSDEGSWFDFTSVYDFESED